MSEDWKTKTVSLLLGSIPALMVVLGAAILILGMAEKLQYDKSVLSVSGNSRILAEVVGAAMIAAGFVLYLMDKTKAKITKASDYGVKITFPAERDRVDKITMHGSIKKSPPEGYKLRVFRTYNSGGYVPIGGEAEVFAETKTWKATGCSVGGDTNEEKVLKVYMIGPGGQELLSYFDEASIIHNRMRQKLVAFTKEKEDFLPLIYAFTRDMVECAKVSVIRS
jgi:hypothetical protein